MLVDLQRAETCLTSKTFTLGTYPYSDACHSAYGLTHLGNSNITGPLRLLGGYVLMGGLHVSV